MPLTHVLLHGNSTARWLCRRKFASYGAQATFRPHAYAINTHRIHIGQKVTIRPGCMLFAVDRPDGTITIEDNVLMGSGVHIYVGNHQFSSSDAPIMDQGFQPFQPVRIEQGAWIGACVIVLPGVNIGRNAVVGAGSIVTRDVPAATVVAGNPAKILRHIDDAKDSAAT